MHCDYAVSGVQDMLTTWLPLMDIPPVLGGLAIRPGGHLGTLQRPHLLSPAERHWATAHYHPGDVLLFHCLTPHAALPNNGTALRLSGDFRWQRPDRPAPAELILGPGLARAWAGDARGPGRGTGREMFSRLLEHQEWWEPVPAGLTLCPRARLTVRPPGPSRFFAVHPGWQRWRPPPAAAH